MQSPLVTILTPVYNCAAWLDQCISSVLAQTYKNWEHVILDNCSTDGSLEIATRYANDDARIKVVAAREFLPQVRNVNRTMQLITSGSEYCKPLLGDDWLHPECLAEMVSLAMVFPQVGIVGSYSVYRDQVLHRGVPYTPRCVMSGTEAARCYLQTEKDEDYFLGSPTAVMFRSDLVRKRRPFYPEENRYFSDTEACMDLFSQADFGFIHKPLTFNRRGNSEHWDKIEKRGPMLLHVLMLTTKYGRRYLNEDEYCVHIRRVNKRYYSMLGGALLARRSRDFWEFHREQLSYVGIRLDMSRVRHEALRRTADAALNPKRTFDRFMARRR